MTIPDELVEIGARRLEAEGLTRIRDYSRDVSRTIISELLPKLGQMMLEPIEGATCQSEFVSAFFKEKLGIELE